MASLSVARKISSLVSVLVPAIAVLLAAGCSSGGPVTEGGGGSATGGTTANGGTTGNGGTSTSGGTTGNGGSTAKGGTTGNGGTTTTGETTGNGGTTTTGGTSTTGGTPGKGGTTGNGGTTGAGRTTSSGGTLGVGRTTGAGGTTSSGGTLGVGGTLGSGGVTAKGGTTGLGGAAGKGGAPGAGGQTGLGGADAGSSSSDGGGAPLNCSAIPAMPTGGSSHSGNSQGGTGNLAWQIWSNKGTGTLVTFANTTAFSSGWSDSGNYLGRMGFEWGSAGKSFETYGDISAQFAETKSGSSGGSWSYIGIYGWSNNPCIEWYIIDDSYSKMPTNPGSCTNMSNSPLSIDGGKYTMCVRSTSGTGGDRCGGAGTWNQYYSIRQDNRTCGTISVTEHFKAWAAAGNKLGNLLEVKILLEVGGGTGTVDFPIANVTKTQ